MVKERSKEAHSRLEHVGEPLEDVVRRAYGSVASRDASDHGSQSPGHFSTASFGAALDHGIDNGDGRGLRGVYEMVAIGP